ncbi:hypothetical protein U0070_003275 [Myodes glareolus]|uniref:Uncharacterized protein n=1 Tax=Myodes glareolus TaxID=447135 RepID=A0AAW0H1U9_MYOGA
MKPAAGVPPVQVSLLRDVDSLAKKSKHLYEGAQSESAEALRELAEELEEKMGKLAKFYTTLITYQLIAP